MEQIRENNKLLKDLINTITDKIATPQSSSKVNHSDKTWITAQESAVYVGVNYNYFMNVVRHQQRFTTKRDGRRVLFSIEELDAYKNRVSSFSS